MPSVRLFNVSFSYTSAVDVIADASLDLGPGWAGVVGANGSGKSTLLRLISGELSPTRGSVLMDPSDPMPTLCPQEVGEPDDSVCALADAWDGVGRRLLGVLSLVPSDLDRWDSLSPGERKRWQIGGALAREPEILLLDEPTNHLDADARSRLTAALERFRGVGLVVSHDRTLLNELTTKTIRVDHGEVELSNGNYETARASWAAVEDRRVVAYENAKAEQDKLERRLADQRRSAETKRAKHKRQLRRAGPKDHDARSMEAKGRHRAGESSGARQIGTTQSAVERAGERVSGFEIRRKIGRSFFFGYEPARRSRLLVHRGPLRAGQHLIAEEVDVEVRREDRIWLRGPNGAGKTALLDALTASSTLPEARLLYLPQELSRQDAAAKLIDLEQLPSEQKSRILNLVATLGVDPGRLLDSRLPSPGEARKLAMAIGMGGGAWCLVLDEPTNHLDLPSIERLEEAIAGYPGAVLLVTHDEEFAANTTTRTWQLEGGTLVEVP